MSKSKTEGRPILAVAISLKADSDFDRLLLALNEIAQQDPTIGVHTEAGALRAIVSGMSEPHLDSVCDHLRQEYKIGIEVGEPRVIYLETIRKAAEAEGKYIRQTGGAGNYGHCKLRIEPNSAGEGYEFLNDIRGSAIPDQFIKSIDRGVQSALALGVLFGAPLVDVKVTLLDGSFHETDSNEMAFMFAGSIALKEAARKASPVLLEPVMAVEVTVPEEFLGVTIGDINSRRGRIEGMEYAAGSQAIKAIVPLAEVLSTSTHGCPDYPMHFFRYEAAPHGGWPGGEAGVAVNNPRIPRAGSGSEAAIPDWESE